VPKIFDERYYFFFIQSIRDAAARELPKFFFEKYFFTKNFFERKKIIWRENCRRNYFPAWDRIDERSSAVIPPLFVE